jgi:hypothetical protein
MELKDMTFLQILELQIFQEELDQQMQKEMNTYLAARKHGKVARMALTTLMERGKFTMSDMTAAYNHIMHKEATGYSANERQYIQDVCTIAYTATIRRLQQESEENDRNPLLRFVRWLLAKLKIKKDIV